MSYSECFDIGYLKVSEERGENIFLSVTPNMRLGPGIQRDGISSPKMTDPHTVPFVMDQHLRVDLKSPLELPATDNAWVQRAGTWTLFDHIKNFHEKYKDEYLIIGVHSCGDLTMNPWHVALIWENDRPTLCCLATEGDPQTITEPVFERTYHCLVKWKKDSDVEHLYEFANLKFLAVPRGHEACLIKPNLSESPIGEEPEERIVTDDIEFALSGKTIVQHGRDVSLANVIDRFQDVRHFFNVPEVVTRDPGGQIREKIYFGEYVLFSDLNARRAALSSPIIVELNIPNCDRRVSMDDLRETLTDKYHYRKVHHSPTRRGEFREYSASAAEIFYPHNVYPFGVLGGKSGELVCLSSGGLSGRVGNTLDGITRIMFNFLGCTDALVLDEGLDTFHILNPNPKERESDLDNYKYDNKKICRQAAAFSMWRFERDEDEFKKAEAKKTQPDRYRLGDSMADWPLNCESISRLKTYCGDQKIKATPPNLLDAIAVAPHRSQMRATLIFAVPRKNIETPSKMSEQDTPQSGESTSA